MSVASGPLVSVITPVYNEEQYLAECIESVLAQTYSNWDYTIVDNCSTDESARIAYQYAARDRRIRVHQNERFLSVIPNHNAALRQASPQSKYCKMVLGDDRIFPTCLEQMVAVAEEHPSVGIVGAYALEGDQVALTGLPPSSSMVCGREICRRHLLDGLYVFGSANAVLYRADLVRNHDPFYNEDNIHADTEVCFALLKECDFGFVHEILTFTRLRQGSLNTASNSLQTSFASMLQLLTTHAFPYLTTAESESLLSRRLTEYYRFLGKSLILGRERQFWEYHRSQLMKAGVGFSRARVLLGSLAQVSANILKPKETLGKFLRFKQTRNHSPHPVVTDSLPAPRPTAKFG